MGMDGRMNELTAWDKVQLLKKKKTHERRECGFHRKSTLIKKLICVSKFLNEK